jgi:hypothetical protein
VITSAPIHKPIADGLNSTVMAHDEPPASCVSQVVRATEKPLPTSS